LLCSIASIATATTHTLSLHDALPIFPSCNEMIVAQSLENAPIRGTLALAPSGGYSDGQLWGNRNHVRFLVTVRRSTHQSVCASQDRKSTRLNSSHRTISYAVFCLKK